MVEAQSMVHYHSTMKRATFANIAKQSWNNLLDSLDMRQRREVRPLRAGETVERAWLNTGRHLRRAMDNYDKTTPQSRSARPSR